MSPRPVGTLAVIASFALVACGGDPQDPTPFDTELDTSVSGGPAAAAAKPYPAGPHGLNLGSIIPNFRFHGWKDPSAAGYDTSRVEPIELADFYDPDGTKGSTVLMINLSAIWCGYCAAEHAGGTYQTQSGLITYRPIEVEIYERAPAGFRFLEAMSQDVQGGPATLSDLQAWAEDYSMTVPFVLDSSEKLAVLRDSVGSFPINLIINTRTMKLMYAVENADPDAIWGTVDRALGEVQ